MKRTKKTIAIALAMTLVISCFNVMAVSAVSSDKLISRVGNVDRHSYVGSEFDLEVKKGSGLSENDIKWTCSNTSIVKYADSDRYDDEMDFKALKKGKVTITATNLVTGGKIKYYVTIKSSGNNLIARVGNATKTVEVGDDIEVNVKKGANLKQSDIKWSVSNTSILAFEDGDKTGTEVEIKGKKKGTAKVTAKNMKTGGKIVYTIKVVPDND